MCVCVRERERERRKAVGHSSMGGRGPGMGGEPMP